jgi:PPK2 family polyphosphate:nucleotide phosphotransferase
VYGRGIVQVSPVRLPVAHHPQEAPVEKQALIDSPRTVSLDAFDPTDTGGMDKAQAAGKLGKLEGRLAHQQELLYAAAQNAVLVVLQGMDTSGKDGTIKHVMASVNPVGVQVSNFKQPTVEEWAHDFLWRVHRRAPALGVLGIFNRSHYEDVLVVRVHKLVPPEVWKRRFEQINDFERTLAQNGTIILKFFLHISTDEQERRLLARERDPEKSWKLAIADWQEREYWDEYQRAYADALGRCATKEAPWYIVPADKKWYRDLFIAQAIVERLEPHERRWERDLKERGKRERAAIEEYRRQHGVQK